MQKMSFIQTHSEMQQILILFKLNEILPLVEEFKLLVTPKMRFVTICISYN